jgi:hypothetical protein
MIVVVALEVRAASKVVVVVSDAPQMTQLDKMR